MKLITKKAILLDLPVVWAAQYVKRESIVLPNGKTAGRVLYELRAESNLTESTAIEIIGNRSWTRNVCAECGEDCDITVQLGLDADYDSSTAKICLTCLKVAQQLIEVGIKSNLK